MKLFNIDFNCAIFDMDGTLLDSMEMWHTASDKYLLSKGKIPETGLWNKVKWLNMTETVNYLISEYALSGKPEEIQEEILRQIQEEYEKNLQLKEGAKELLEKLSERGIPCVLATATARKCVIPCLKRLGIEKYFTGIITCLDLNTSKSRPLIFEKACGLGNSAPGKAVVFEDALHALRTAHSAGFKTCAVYDKSSEEKTEPPETDWQRLVKISDLNIHSLKEALCNLK